MERILIEKLKTKFTNKDQWCLVVGDLMLDRYIFGEITRISPEAPIPILKKSNEQFRMGGAANVAANLSGLGIKTTIAGLIGKDINGENLTQLIREKLISTKGVIKSKGPTTTKTRIISGQQQIIRIDEEEILLSLDKNSIKKILDLIKQRPSIIVISDYAKGLISLELMKSIVKTAKKMKIPVIADPKGNDLEKYKGVTALTPNKNEACTLTNNKGRNELALEKSLKKARREFDIEFIAMTQGDLGVKLITEKKIQTIPASKLKQVFDVSGAGDTIIAAIAVGMMANLTLQDSLEIANIAAGIVISKVGTTPIEKHELINELEDGFHGDKNKLISEKDLLKKLSHHHINKKKIGFTNGCFDILHAGHVSYLEQAKNKVDFLIVGLNSDKSVRKLKGNNRPFINESDRARVLCSLEAVDAVIIFDDDTPINLIKKIKPYFLIKGNDYSINQVVGHKEIKKWGGKVELIPLLQGRSSSKIIKKIS
jgi:D-beta-D-heptose 7-phosphate kinase / D-beta-D-heptose 1-phosphate adenosyltransferase